MNGQSLLLPENPMHLSRRRALKGSGMMVLSASAVALLGGCEAMAAGTKTGDATESDVRILNTALDAEYEAIAAYLVGANSGLLTKDALGVALAFRGHHLEHAEALAATVTKLGGKAVSSKDNYAFPVEALKNQNDVLHFAASLEKGAVSAYLGAVPLFGDSALAQVAASILGDEAMHWAVLRQALGDNPVPSAFMS